MGARVVVVKGGHLSAEASGDVVVDVVCTPQEAFELRGRRIATRHTHGTGCTFAAAIAAYLALGRPLVEAFHEARAYLDGAIQHAPGLGGGAGPLDHFWRRHP
jgi:hydroxymethylpyrimidine/phosphomethylpyrimidine kinase